MKRVKGEATAKSIWKFPMEIQGSIRLWMPTGAVILDIQTQLGELCLWALVDPGAKPEWRHFALRGTGHTFTDDAGVYIGTALMLGGSLVWHVFELEDKG